VNVIDTQGKVSFTGFEITVTQPDGSVMTTGPYEPDFPPVISPTYNTYQKEVLLDATGSTQVQPVLEMADGSEAIRADVVNFGTRGNDLSMTLANFGEVEQTETAVVYGWIRGSRVVEVHVRDALYARPVPAGPWPSSGTPTEILRTEDEYSAAIPPVGSVRYLQFEPRDALGNAGPVQRVVMTGLPDAKPVIEQIRQFPGSAQNTADLTVVITDLRNRGGTLYAWLNRLSPESADPGMAADGFLVLGAPGMVTSSDVWSLTGGSTAQLFDEITLYAGRGKRIYLEYVTTDGTSTGKVNVDLMASPWALDPATGELSPGAIQRAQQFAQSIKPVHVVDSLAATGEYTGEVAVLTTDGKLYRWDGAQWLAVVRAPDLEGEITTTQIGDDAVTTSKILAGQVIASKLYSGSVETDKIQAGHIAGGAVNATHVSSISLNVVKAVVDDLSALTANLGTITAGMLQNHPTSPSNWFDLNAGTGNTDVVLRAGKLDVRGDGTVSIGSQITIDGAGNATFAGELQAASGTFAGDISAATGTFSGTVAASEFTSVEANFSSLIKATGREPTLHQDGGAILRNLWWSPYGNASGNTSWQAYAPASGGTLNFNVITGNDIYFSTDGKVHSHGFVTYSPTPPKSVASMSASDWLAWALADASKPVYPHGVPSVDNPAVQALVTEGRSAEAVVAELDETYAKDLGTIAIGTTRWAGALHQAIKDASDFASFKAAVFTELRMAE
jgi:hypothetical protein